jgi:hypothetical protein
MRATRGRLYCSVVVVAAISASGCSAYTEPVGWPCNSVLLDAIPFTDTLAVGDTLTLSVPADAPPHVPARVIRWSSAAPFVASVDSVSGLVRALAIGDVNVNAVDRASPSYCPTRWFAHLLVR